eukprot:m.69926 g.69926  ORF g.69926 m.69926 type:complete len:547 (-) comp8614_c0_seq3:3485-5125(-)
MLSGRTVCVVACVAAAVFTTPVWGVKFNEIMMRGSQASYRLAPYNPTVTDDVPSLFLCQRPLDRQAMYDGVRAFQLDIHRRPNEEDAFPVFHTNFGGDNRTVCDNVQQCAWVLSRWSDQNPGHLPVIIEFNAVDEPDQIRDDLRPGWPRALEQQLVAVLGDDKIFSPYELIGDGVFDSMNERVKSQGWPDIDDLRGQFIITMTRYNKDVYEDLTSIVRNTSYPAPSDKFFLAACGAYNVTAKNPCDPAELDEPWAVIGDVDFVGRTEPEWTGTINTIRNMVAANFIVNTNVCGEFDTAWYERLAICQNKSDIAVQLGVHVLSDALFSKSNNVWIPAGAVCNPVTANAACSDNDVALIAAPSSDPWYQCDMDQCPVPPPVEDRTTRPPPECKDDDAKIANLTGDPKNTCRRVYIVYPEACTDESSPFFDVAQNYCPVTCGLCDPNNKTDTTVTDTYVVPGESDLTMEDLSGWDSAAGDPEGEYGYVDPCGNITLPKPSPQTNDPLLSDSNIIMLVLGIALIVIIIGFAVYCYQSRHRRGYDTIEDSD